MSRAALLAAAALGAVALAAGCGIETRSGAYACTDQDDCTGGRTCVDGWCVTGGGDEDAAPGQDDGGTDPQVDASSCPGECDRCEGATCVIICNGNNGCAGGVTCPPGRPCQVECGGNNSCPSGVDCTAATACQVTCDRGGACAGPIECGAGPCNVACTANGTCLGGIDCTGSCSCETTCAGNSGCPATPSCPDETCASGRECVAEGELCDTCG